VPILYAGSTMANHTDDWAWRAVEFLIRVTMLMLSYYGTLFFLMAL
jgi:hypothetical protein